MFRKIFIFTLVTLFIIFGALFLFVYKNTSYISPKVTLTEPKQKELIEVDESKENFTPEPFSLEKAFTKEVIENEDIIRVVATGDYGLVREVNYKTITYNNFNWSVEEFAPLLKNADLSLINLEGPLTYNCPIAHSGFTFCGDSKHVNGLKYAGIDVVNLANNHAGNYGIQGVNETQEILLSEDILIGGLHENNIVYKDVKGSKISFLGYNDVGVQVGTAQADIERIKNEVPIAKKTSDIVIVSMHWGVEYTTEITERQKELAYTAIDNGADLVIGNHPHWIQPVEVYKGKLIAYAHGNFIFDQMWSEETKEGVVGEYVFYENKLIDVNYYPVYIEDYGKATIPNKEVSKRILTRIKEISYEYASLQMSNPLISN